MQQGIFEKSITVTPDYCDAAAQLSPYGFVYHHVVVFHHVCLNGSAKSRSFFKHAHIYDSAHCHVQRARDGCRGQREYIGVYGYLLQLFLLCDAETLLFIDYDKSEIVKLHIF